MSLRTCGSLPESSAPYRHFSHCFAGQVRLDCQVQLDRGDPSRLVPKPFHLTRRVEFHETDLGGVMHFSAFFLHMEAAEHALLRSLGLNVHTKQDGRTISFPRVSTRCDFQRPLRFSEEFLVSVRVQQVGEKSVTYAFDFTHDGQDIAAGEMTSVCCEFSAPGDLPKSIPIPADIAAKLRDA